MKVLDDTGLARLVQNITSKFAPKSGQITGAVKLTNEDLNDYVTVDKLGFYYADSGNTVKNKPLRVDHFGLIVVRAAEGIPQQILFGSNGALNTFKIYHRRSSNDWVTLFDDKSTIPIANGGTGATTQKAANNAIMGYDANVSNLPSDEWKLLWQKTIPNATDGAIVTTPLSALWTYLTTKIRSMFGFSSSNVLSMTNGGTGATTREQALKNLGVTVGTSAAPSTGTPNTIYVQILED